MATITIEGRHLEVLTIAANDMIMSITMEDGTYSTLVIRNPYQSNDFSENTFKALKELEKAIDLDLKQQNRHNEGTIIKQVSNVSKYAWHQTTYWRRTTFFFMWSFLLMYDFSDSETIITDWWGAMMLIALWLLPLFFIQGLDIDEKQDDSLEGDSNA